MMEEEEYCWVEAAMEDDAVVAEQLLRLKPPKTMEAVEWGVRQPRSRHVQHQSSHRSSKKEVGDSTTRGSPTTPLSWSGDSYDDSALPPRPPPPPPPPLPAFRSIKGAGGSDASNRKTRKRRHSRNLKKKSACC
ncbi:hypothetical protein Syun_011203 [Stephania yunnanensis]|uniref:Uncharacterized protein n=1 Tax=Stephania yunnanensis TaxID=152371 RepID=A0AAP0PE75_9MAGN